MLAMSGKYFLLGVDVRVYLRLRCQGYSLVDTFSSIEYSGINNARFNALFPNESVARSERARSSAHPRIFRIPRNCK